MVTHSESPQPDPRESCAAGQKCSTHPDRRQRKRPHPGRSADPALKPRTAWDVARSESRWEVEILELGHNLSACERAGPGKRTWPGSAF